MLLANSGKALQRSSIYQEFGAGVRFQVGAPAASYMTAECADSIMERAYTKKVKPIALCALHKIAVNGRQDDIAPIRFVSGEDGSHNGVTKTMILRSDCYVYVTSRLEGGGRPIEDNTQFQNEREQLPAYWRQP